MRRSYAIAITVALFCSYDARPATNQGTYRSFDFVVKDREVKAVLKELAAKTRRNIAVSPGLRGLVSGAFRQSTLDHILSALLPPIGAGYRDDGAIVQVFPKGSEPSVSPFHLKLPYVGPAGAPSLAAPPYAVGGQPQGATPQSAPYFGHIHPRMPLTNFMDPRIPDPGPKE